MRINKALWFGLSCIAIVVGMIVFLTPWGNLNSGHIGLLMLALIVVAIMLGFPTAFTLMGMGVLFTFLAYSMHGDGFSLHAVRQTLDLMVQRTYATMTNESLISIPLFVFMGYLVERANLIEKLFRSMHLALARLPGALAVATLLTCAIFATATGIVGAVVTLMGLLAMPAMLKAGYSTGLTAGSITAGGCLGILIPPSVMLIVYGATTGVSVVQLYAGALLPGIMLTGLYVLYVVGLSAFRPDLAPRLSASDRHIPLPEDAARVVRVHPGNAVVGLLAALFQPRRGVAAASRPFVWTHLAIAFAPLAMFALVMGALHQVVTTPAATYDIPAELRLGGSTEPPGDGGLMEPIAGGLAEPPMAGALAEPPATGTLGEPPATGALAEPPVHASPDAPASTAQTGTEVARAASADPGTARPASAGAPQATPTAAEASDPASRLPAPNGYWIAFAILAAMVVLFYLLLNWPRLQIFRMLLESFFPLAIMIAAVLGSITFGLATPSEAAAMGALGGALLALAYRRLNMPMLKESVYLTTKTTAMVCWLFVGSSIFSAAFALLGGQALVEAWVLSLGLSKLEFLLLAQVIIFLLGWPLEWTEIIVIFMPIFVPLLQTFEIDPLFFGLLVALNLQTAFLSPPVAMAAFYLKGVAPPHVTLNSIFVGMLPFMGIQIVAIFLLYVFPGIGLWLPALLYG
ncbi:TRAP transporter large permease [Bordetella flabilis]|uniref:C4-dicarboxylate ABC transporter n=1 Tax=Bordetella flabilis TaxID=463014 RepID=A0A193GIJ8_9BORD|nr:TRAP transporter large permease subunit [Bordetella flabilis]ANN79665.1 C4-dicarboxylate ABC transporter [Bordetella flabilis]